MRNGIDVFSARDGVGCIFSCLQHGGEILSVVYNDVTKLCSCLLVPAACVPREAFGVEVYLVNIRGKKHRKADKRMM